MAATVILIVRTRQAVLVDMARIVIVCGSALALISAGQVLPALGA